VSAEGEDFRLDGGDGAWLAAPGRRRFVLDGAGEALLLRVQRAGTGLEPAQ